MFRRGLEQVGVTWVARSGCPGCLLAWLERFVGIASLGSTTNLISPQSNALPDFLAPLN